MQRVVTYPRWVLRLCLGFLSLLVVLNVIFPLPLDKARNVSPVVLDRYGGWVAGFTVDDGIWRIKADLDVIDPRFVEHLISIEDARFYNHSGVDVGSIIRAARSWQRAGKPVSGASTLTMQLVRQIEPRPRTVPSKIIESFRALQYELFLSKDEILELYLSHISYGGNIDGVHAATLTYFKKPPSELTDAEIALLIAIPQAPEARRPDLWPNVAKRGRDKILAKLRDKERLSDLQYKEATEMPVTVLRNPMPETAWLSARSISEKGETLRSTLDMRVQRDVEAVAAQYLETLPKNVNVALTVIENDTMAVRAHMGSGGRDRDGGWLDMTRRYRSPGSTLKPFIYGLAMDDGLIDGGSWINDAPVRFGSYRPENFNKRYYGQVRIHEALRHSLNIPAVTVLDQIGGLRLEETLTAGGMDVVRLRGDSEAAGLALALGGAGITVNDLALGYAALANGGEARPLRWRENDKPSRPVRMLSQSSADELTSILEQSPTPDGQVPAWLSPDFPAIAYKTGTSYGFRDAWAAGYTDKWTVVVWVGRPDGAPRNGETGRKAAAPLLFDVFAALPREDGHKPYIKDETAPGGLKRIKDPIEAGPQILFPPNGAELLSSQFGDTARGFTLSARAKDNQVRFFVDGQKVDLENRRSIWRPETPGFYEVRAVDARGREAVSRVSVLAFQEIADPRF